MKLEQPDPFPKPLRTTTPASREYAETSRKTPRNILRQPPKLPPMPNIKGDR